MQYLLWYDIFDFPTQTALDRLPSEKLRKIMKIKEKGVEMKTKALLPKEK